MRRIILEDIQIGAKFKYIGKSNGFPYEDFDEAEYVEVIMINQANKSMVLRTSKGIEKTWYWNVPSDGMLFELEPKPHEYSPVFMTGRYRTVGD